jgi:hypothetical protein
MAEYHRRNVRIGYEGAPPPAPPPADPSQLAFEEAEARRLFLPAIAGGMAGDNTTPVGSWTLSVLGDFFTKYLADARGTPTWYPYSGTVLVRWAQDAIDAYDGGEPYPFLLGEQARWFLDYLKRNGG